MCGPLRKHMQNGSQQMVRQHDSMVSLVLLIQHMPTGDKSMHTSSCEESDAFPAQSKHRATSPDT